MSALPEKVLNRMSPGDRKRLGKAGRTFAEAMELSQHKMERDLQMQLISLLRCRGIVAFWQPPTRRSQLPVGTPDILFALPSGQAMAWEVKTAAGKLAPEQVVMHERMIANGWRVLVVRSVDEAVNFLKAEVGR